MTSFDATVVGSLFLAAAAMLWIGWVLLPVRIGPFFDAADFSRVHERLRLWIWLFRIHLFGYILTIMAFVALASVLAGSPLQVVVWPAVAAAAVGLLVAVLAQAFYYHFGAWGAIDMNGKSDAAVGSFLESLQVPTEYVTCFVRFGRVFFGLGQVVLGIALLYGGILPWWVGGSALVLGVAAMALTMGLPDSLHLYHPLFHVNALWLVALGLSVLSSG